MPNYIERDLNICIKEIGRIEMKKPILNEEEKRVLRGLKIGISLYIIIMTVFIAILLFR